MRKRGMMYVMILYSRVVVHLIILIETVITANSRTGPC